MAADVDLGSLSWDRPCSDAHLVQLSQLINDWRQIAPALGLTPTDEQNILGYAPFSVPAQRIEMLRTWKQRQRQRTTYRKLADAFRWCGRQDLVEEVSKLVRGTSLGEEVVAGENVVVIVPEPLVQELGEAAVARENVVVIVPEPLVEELGDLRFAFASLTYRYKSVLQNSPEAQKKFVEFLPHLFRHRTAENHSFQSHFNTLIEEEVSLFNIFYLKRICHIFPEDVCATTKQLVDEYERKRQRFMAGKTVTQFKELFPGTATSSKLLSNKLSIKLKLKNFWDRYTIEDLTKLVALFGVSSNHLHLSKVEDGCIAVTWLCSTSEIKQLTMAILETAGSLQTMGVLQVFVEEDLVLECCHPVTDESQSNKLHALEPTVTEQYISYLKEYYRIHFSQPRDDKEWPDVQIDQYIKLSVAKDCDFFLENVDQLSLEGIDELVSRKKTIEIDGIACLKANGAFHRGVLIIGAPGIGKTSLVRQLCFEWAQGKLLQHYEIVILFQLRDKGVLTTETIGKVINFEDPANGEAVFDQMKKNNGEKVLLIFDGYDEAPAELNGSLVQRLLEGKTLPSATVLITSRPVAINELVNKYRFKQKLEVLGFTKTSILQYANQFFMKKNMPNEINQFELFLEMSPHICALMYVPLHCAIVTDAYSFNLLSDRSIHTMTDLYTNLTLSLLSRYSSSRYTSYDDLPDDVAVKFWTIAELAYYSYFEENFVLVNVPDDLLKLGFFQSFSRMYNHKDSFSLHTFLHLTLQEYLAALYAVKKDDKHEFTDLNDTLAIPCFIVGLSDPKSVSIDPTGNPLVLIPLLFEMQSASKINSIVSSSDDRIDCKILDPLFSYMAGYVIAVTLQKKWLVEIPHLTSHIIVCFCLGFEAGGGQCDQIDAFRVSMTCPNDYFCIPKLPQNFLNSVLNVVLLSKEEHLLYADEDLLCQVWELLPQLKRVVYESKCRNFLLAKKDIHAFSAIYHSAKNTNVITYYYFKYTDIGKMVVCFFWVKSTLGCLLTSYPEHKDYLEWLVECSAYTNGIPLQVLLDEFSWFADLSQTTLEDMAHKYWYNPYLHLGMVNPTAQHLTTITITGGQHCPQSTVTLLHHILHNNLLPSTVIALNLILSSSTIVYHLLTALSYNHQLICWRITDCSMFLRK